MNYSKPVIKYSYNSTGTLIRLVVPGVKAFDGGDYTVLLLAAKLRQSWQAAIEDALVYEQERLDSFTKIMSEDKSYNLPVNESGPYKEYKAGITYLEKLLNHAKYGLFLPGEVLEVQFPEPKQYQEG